jgi:hypothetical protein
MRKLLTLENPALDADRAGLRVCGHLAVVNVGAKRVKRHAALAVPFGTRDFGPAKPA